ncbi:FAD-dependent oxidoreductase [Novimethylophilus kurashikiensis]|uniref:FAD-dependent oxidoreductase n=1 Tax=Novimethylophilus kurashikiensis TaxID=1825523 RepID=A0A2R5F4L6_9PROT|nr:NAD(P)/FAD-dependent oxidoreductase [Novimethylophilus kurashikiensis]GBG13342.1 FAD-dependent oxidoreductase [Novimethylophilus kurashikiensis]
MPSPPVGYEALIIGGGPAGAPTAMLLARAGRRVAVLEQSTFPRRKVCGEFISAPSLALLDALGLGQAFSTMAGPEVREVGLFVGRDKIVVPMPVADGSPYGRALSRDKLDTWLLDQASQAGATIYQPYKALALEALHSGWRCTAQHRATNETLTIEAPVVIAAHGSWESGRLPTQTATSHTPHDLLGFKAHFRNSRLPPGLMPLLVFPGGYGGMVESDGGRVSLSCCIRRDRLAAIRQPGMSAGEAVLRHIASHCLGVAEVVEGAVLEDDWLAAGPIQPGLRRAPHPGIFLVGNAAGEAHPIIADGLSIALQSAWLLSQRLLAQPSWDNPPLQAVAKSYEAAYRKQFGPRIHASQVFAQLAIRPWATTMLLPMFRAVPQLLGLGARLAGKTMALE